MLDLSLGCRKLISLKASSCSKLTDYSGYCISTFYKLETLSLVHCNKISDLSVQRIARNCQSLKSLDVYGM